MTLAAPVRVEVIPAAASAAVRPLLAGDAEGMLLGAGERGAWARFGDDVLVLSAAGGRRMPNGVEVPAPARALLDGPAAGVACFLTDGRLRMGDWSLRVDSWWNPRPALPRVDPATLGARAAWVRGRFVPAEDRGLDAGLAAGHLAAVHTAAACLLGRGPGLTPLGDDVLAGAVAAALLLGEAAGHDRLYRLAAAVAPGLCAAARERTTALSATLLRHACRGEVDDASAGLLQALCGQGDLSEALGALLAVGHSSGRGLATGILAGAAAAGGAS